MRTTMSWFSSLPTTVGALDAQTPKSPSQKGLHSCPHPTPVCGATTGAHRGKLTRPAPSGKPVAEPEPGTQGSPQRGWKGHGVLVVCPETGHISGPQFPRC